MKIVIFHPADLPPRDYGGTERVVLWLASGLVEHGHQVIVAAYEGSKMPPGVELLALKRDQCSPLSLPPLLPDGVDVVHFMAPPPAAIWDQLPCAACVTIHGNGIDGESFHPNSIFISRDHARRHRAECFVYNGIDPSEYWFNGGARSDSFLFFSKTSWSVKNLKGAIGYCRQAHVALNIAGGSRPYWRRLQSLWRQGQSWIGPVAGQKKAKLLGDARALVFPVQWPEPFGLVVVEALASGTPVLASPYGSLPELLTPEVGAIIKEDQEWIDRLSRFQQTEYDPQVCRRRVEDHFSHVIMAKNYLQKYERVIKGEPLNPRSPQAGPWSSL